MKERNDRILIELFFKGNPVEEARLKFQRWFLTKSNGIEKEKALVELWEETEGIDDCYSEYALRKVNKRIKNLEFRISPVWKSIMKVAVIVMLPIMASVFTYLFLQKNQTSISPVICEVFAGFGENKQILLPDGSRVNLNAGSVLVYPEKFNKTLREVYLSGEGNFQVEKDPNKPFIVKTKRLVVQALGTTFNVRSYPDDKKAIVSLEEGKVKVDLVSGKEIAYLLPNQMVSFNSEDGTLLKEDVDAEKLSKWMTGSLVFQSASFDYIMKSLQRHYNMSFNYDAGKYADRHFTVTFYPETKVDEVLGILKQMIVDFQYSRNQENVYIN